MRKIREDLTRIYQRLDELEKDRDEPIYVFTKEYQDEMEEFRKKYPHGYSYGYSFIHQADPYKKMGLKEAVLIIANYLGLRFIHKPQEVQPDVTLEPKEKQ